MKKRPHQRPNAKELLRHPQFQRRLGFNHGTPGSPTGKGKQPLLKTIKLPTDLTKLKEKLPTPKYDTPLQNKSELLVGEYQPVSDPKPKTPKSKVNQSEVFTNPTTPTHSSQQSRQQVGPSSCIKLGEQGPSSSSKLEQRSARPYSSDRKATNKVEGNSRRNYERYYNVNHYYP